MHRAASQAIGIFFSLLLISCSSGDREHLSERSGPSESGEPETTITIAFYNVENLFDTVDDPATKDEDFTPGGLLKWDEKRLDKKLEDITRAINGIDETNGPDIIGFAEVENRAVMERLVGDYLPRDLYKVVHEDSPDGRGIDVALIYRPGKMKVRRQKLHPIDLGSRERPTRSVMEVEFERGGEPFTVLVNHWPSRSGGERESRWKRERAANVVSAVVDSLSEADPIRDIVLIGDFNDEPYDASIADILAAGPFDPRDDVRDGPPRLYNLAWEIAKADTFGTYLYRDSWDVLDQIIVSPQLLDGKRLTLKDQVQTIYAPSFLRDDHPSQPMLPPRRTYIRRTLYIGGTSDHFPVFARFAWY